MDAAVAFELMHTASLIHDDVIDKASTRRGKDAVHIRWNNKISVLSGDYFLSQAFKILVTYNNWPLMNIVVDITQNMAEGEVEQAFANRWLKDLEERYFQWIGKKSASFFAGCCKAGSLLGGDSLEDQNLWAEFGYNLGIAFQLIDDLLDYTGEGGITGKPLYGDLNNGVITLPLIRALHSGNNKPEESSIDYIFKDQILSKEDISLAARYILKSDGPAYTYSKAEDYAKKAAVAIKTINSVQDDKKAVLEELTRDVLLRKK